MFLNPTYILLLTLILVLLLRFFRSLFTQTPGAGEPQADQGANKPENEELSDQSPIHYYFSAS